MHGIAIRRNTIQCMQAIVEATGALDIELVGEAAAAGARVTKLDESAELSPRVVQVRVCARAPLCVYIAATRLEEGDSCLLFGMCPQ